MIDTFISGVKTFYNVECEAIYHYTDSMRNSACCIKIEPTFNNDDVQEMVQVNVLDLENKNAMTFVMYWDEPLPPLVLRRMIKDIVVFQKYKSHDIFIEFLKEMSVQYMEAVGQDIPEHSQEVFDDICMDIELINEVEANRRNEKTNS